MKNQGINLKNIIELSLLKILNATREHKSKLHNEKLYNLFPLNTQYQIGIYSLHSNVEIYHSVNKLPIDNYMKVLIENIRIVRENTF